MGFTMIATMMIVKMQTSVDYNDGNKNNCNSAEGNNFNDEYSDDGYYEDEDSKIEDS